MRPISTRAPEHLTVLVSLYRYYFYQHRLEDVLVVADHAKRISARHLGIPNDWRLAEAQTPIT